MDQSRRDALKKLGLATGVGAVATTEWAKPVVNALVVPAHAQTTSGSSGGGSSCPSTLPGDISPFQFDYEAVGSNYVIVVGLTTSTDISGCTVTITNKSDSNESYSLSNDTTSGNNYSFIATVGSQPSDAEYTVLLGSNEVVIGGGWNLQSA